MKRTPITLAMINCFRYYHVSHNLCNIKKQGFKLAKMMSPKVTKQWYPTQQFDDGTLPSVKSLAKTKYEPGKRANRRVAMLNKIFMKQVTDLMSTGTVSMEIVGRGIEISKVQMTSDFETLKVFWVCKGNTTDEETEKVLKKTAGVLRHELSTLRAMGEVPYITFVKDQQEAQVLELDRLLTVADYGEDYKPTEMGQLLKTEFTLESKLSPEMKAKIKQLEDELPFEDDPIPEMTHYVYGLDHAKIMSRLLAARKKSKDAWVNVTKDDSLVTYRVPAVKPNDDNLENQRKELADFLMKRQILQNKLQKQLRSVRDQMPVQYQLSEDLPQDTNDEEYVYSEDDEEDEEYFYYEDTKTPDTTRPDTS